jgi:ADP-ribose pyrophosphatase YjhB (NUDIX family)
MRSCSLLASNAGRSRRSTLSPIGLGIGNRRPSDERSRRGTRRDTPQVPGYYRDPLAPTPNDPRVIGAAALIPRSGALLLDCRSDDGTWGLPAGRVEDDETVSQAVVREVREETGLETVALELFGIFSDPTRIVEYRDGNVYGLVTIAFTITASAGAPVASEESREVRFVPVEELCELELFPTHRPIIDAYLSCPAGVVVA